eukprot:1191208-Prorocentrum_minimum.AAC.4
MDCMWLCDASSVTRRARLSPGHADPRAGRLRTAGAGGLLRGRPRLPPPQVTTGLRRGVLRVFNKDKRDVNPRDAPPAFHPVCDAVIRALESHVLLRIRSLPNLPFRSVGKKFTLPSRAGDQWVTPR